MQWNNIRLLSGTATDVYGPVLTVMFTIVPNFSKWLLSLVMVLRALGIFLMMSVSDGSMGYRGPPKGGLLGRNIEEAEAWDVMGGGRAVREGGGGSTTPGGNGEG